MKFILLILTVLALALTSCAAQPLHTTGAPRESTFGTPADPAAAPTADVADTAATPAATPAAAPADSPLPVLGGQEPGLLAPAVDSLAPKPTLAPAPEPRGQP